MRNAGFVYVPDASCGLFRVSDQGCKRRAALHAILTVKITLTIYETSTGVLEWRRAGRAVVRRVLANTKVAA